MGKSVLRRENGPLLTGRGAFIDDIPVKKGTLHAAMLRSPHAHAEIGSIDASAAMQMPGVRAVVTGRDMRELTNPMIVGLTTPMEYYCLAVDRVRFVGEPVAIVCAADRYTAEDALDLIEVEYKPLPAVVDPVAAAQPDAPIIHPKIGSNVFSRRVFHHGDPEKAFAEAPRQTGLTIHYPRNSITPIECYGLIAEHGPDSGSYDVLSNFQGPFSLHPVMALALRIPGNKLRLRSPVNSGGSFGSKLTLFPYIVAMCVASRIAGRPVKWIEDRLEHLAAASCAPNRVTRIEAAYTDAGEVTALRFEHWDDHGAFLRAPMPGGIFRMQGITTSCYTVRHTDVVMNIMATNKCPTGAVRGFGGPQHYFALERLMSKIARELGADPLDVIRRNLIPADAFPYRAVTGALLDSGNYEELISALVDEGKLEELRARRDQARNQGRLYGIGFAAAIEPSQSNMGYISTLKTREERARAGPKDGATANATVSIDPLGSVNVMAESVPQGQGHQTVLAQIVADQLGLQPHEIAVNLEVDTQKDVWLKSELVGNDLCQNGLMALALRHRFRHH
ncbi:MAG: xanthine dehydrogenase family protein molybdopterin-binding subunit, partial [Alphaproteobacteria bacterium]